MTESKPEGPPRGGPNIQIELPEKEAEGIYANLTLITHSPSEVVLDFARVLPSVPKSRVYARIIMTPYNAKSLLKALEDNLHRYEAQFGQIRLVGQANEGKNIGF